MCIRDRVDDLTLMSDYIADFAQNWLEDNIKPEVYEGMEKTAQKYSDKQSFESKIIQIFEGYLTYRADTLEQQISKTEE